MTRTLKQFLHGAVDAGADVQARTFIVADQSVCEPRPYRIFIRDDEPVLVAITLL